MSSPGAFTQVVPTAVAGVAVAANKPRTRRGLEVSALACELAGRADWRTGRLRDWSVSATVAGTGWSWWRLRHALDALAAQGVVTEGRGELSLDLDRVRHQPGGDDSRPFVQLLPGAIAGLAAHHGWSRVATDIFTHLVLVVDGAGRLEATSQAALAGDCGTGWPTMHTVLGELAASGVLEGSFARGQRVDVAVTGRAAVVRPRPAPVPQRRERRAAASPHGAADEAARRLWAHYGLAGLVAPGLVAAFRRAVREGAPAEGVLERVVAGGALQSLRDPVAGLIARVQAAAEAFAQAAQDAAAARERREQAEATLAAQAAAEAAEVAEVAADSRWVVSVLGPAVVATLAERHGRLLGRQLAPAAAAGVLDWARPAVAVRADLGPAEALAYALGHDPPPGPAGPIGADATGPTIAEVLSAR